MCHAEYAVEPIGLFVHRLEFIKDPLKNATTFIDKHWDIIRRTAEQEGLIKWLLVRTNPSTQPLLTKFHVLGADYEVPSLLYSSSGRPTLQEVPATFALNACTVDRMDL
jgi:hypothetical protein